MSITYDDQYSKFQIGNIGINKLTFSEALVAIKGLVERGQGGMVFTPNVDHIVLAESDHRLRAAYAAADLSLVDGMPVLWASHFLGDPLPEKISGSDLVEPLVSLAAREGWGVYILGGARGVSLPGAARDRRGTRRRRSISISPGICTR